MTWQEELHPRDEGGRFAESDGGGRGVEYGGGLRLTRHDADAEVPRYSGPEAVEHYINGEFWSVNGMLRSDAPLTASEMGVVRGLDAGIAAGSTMAEENVEKLYRGVDPGLRAEFDTLQPGDTWTDRAFLSTSEDIEVAEEYAEDDFDQGAIMVIHPDPETRSIDGAADHQEHILARDATLEFIGRQPPFPVSELDAFRTAPFYNFRVRA